MACEIHDSLKEWIAADSSGPWPVRLAEHLERCESCRGFLANCQDASAQKLKPGCFTLTNPEVVASELMDRLKQVPEEANSGGCRDLAAMRSDTTVPPEIPRYKVLHQIGRGGCGTVYRARDLQFSRDVAIKILHGDVLNDIERARFMEECRIAGRLQHSGIVQVFDAGETPDHRLYLVMEFVDGITLADRLKTGSEIPIQEIVEIASQIAEGLGAAHIAGVVHRDIKPANVMLVSPDRQPGSSATPRLRILDFGLALATEREQQLTSTGVLIGTPHYMSPEQVQCDSNIDARADVYALGATLYELLTGEPPFRGPAHRILQQILSTEPQNLLQLRPDLPRDLAVICQKAMSREASKRYLNGGKLADDLRRFQRGEAIFARPIGIVERGLRWARRNRAVAALTLGLLLTIFTGIAGVIWQWRRAANFAIEMVSEAGRANVAERAATISHEESERNFLKARAVVDRFYRDLYSSGELNKPGLEQLRSKIRKDLVSYYTDFVEQASNDPSQLAANAQAHINLARALHDDNKMQALELYQQALPLLERLVTGPDSERWIEEQRLTLQQLSALFIDLDRFAEAITISEKLVNNSRLAWHRNQNHLPARIRLAASLGNHAISLANLGRQTDAYQAFVEVLEHFESAGKSDPDNLSFRNAVGRTQFNLAIYAPDEEVATKWLIASKQTREGLVEQQGENSGAAFDLGKTLFYLSEAYRKQNRTGDAVRCYCEGHDSVLRSIGNDSPDPARLLELCLGDCSGASLLIDCEPARTERILRHDLRMLQSILTDNPEFLGAVWCRLHLQLDEVIERRGSTSDQLLLWLSFIQHPALEHAEKFPFNSVVVQACLKARDVCKAAMADSDREHLGKVVPPVIEKGLRACQNDPCTLDALKALERKWTTGQP